MTFLGIDHVSKRYGTVLALDGVSLGVSLGVAAGSRTAIVGPSGSGKTTLLRLIAGFEAPDTGRIVLDGELLADGAAAMPAFRRGVGVVMQDGALFPHLDVAENIGFGLPGNLRGQAARIAELLGMVGLPIAMASRRPDALSGGQQQRVALARALARKPRLMLLDEPFSALDTGLRAATRKAVATLLADAGIATILVTHDQTEALSFADQVAVMGGGRLLQVGAPRELYLRPLTPMIASFLGEAIILPATLADGVADCALGPVAVDDARRQGAADILLRPEQVSLAAPTPGAALAQVLDCDFAGPACAVTLRLQSGETVALRQPGIAAPDIGATVAIMVHGTAHAFAAGD